MMKKLRFRIDDEFRGTYVVAIARPEEEYCRQCGEVAEPDVYPPDPSQGRRNGFASCPSCGAIFWGIGPEEFQKE